MIVSLNEVATMGKRAARGAGMSWGLAEDAGLAARWLARYGLPGPELLADLLDGQDCADYESLAPEATDGRWSATGARLCPIISGAALCDRARQLTVGHDVNLGPVAQPALLAAQVSAASTLTGWIIELTWTDVVMTIGPRGVSIDGDDAALQAGRVDWVRCRQTDAVGKTVAPISGGYEVDPEQWSRLDTFAQKSYAPATEASRLSGAGAGLIDD